ncbi:MAG: DEAD/DEAH box helicase [Acidimicrobiia bacterium]|nr:DEAD/DEAH box helicase [Acidimicrobiia bacterium]
MTSSTEDTVRTERFESLGIAPELIATLADRGITEPFPIQTMAIPDALTGRDVCGKAQTGSGKTIAFGIPMVMHRTETRPHLPFGLILVPTRELCLQVSKEMEMLAEPFGLRVVAVYGGVSLKHQVDEVKRGVDIVVATPGRLIDLGDRGALSLEAVEIVVLDEADQMADMGFLPQVDHVLRQIEVEHQTMLFSATLDGAVDRLVKRHMADPVYHEVETAQVTVDTMEHRFLEVHHMDKPKVVAAIANSTGRVLVFVRTKRGCDRVAEQLRKEGLAARAIHGDLPQQRRERVLSTFVSGTSPVLVATNVAARGLHIEGVDVVIHYDPPQDSKTYLHRSGRTARAGDIGLVVTLVEYNQIVEVRTLQKEAEVLQPIVKMFSNDPRLRDLMAFEPPEFVAFEPSQRRRRRRR